MLSILGTVILSPSFDRWICDLNGDGTFRVKDIRAILDDMFLPSASEATRWVKYIPIKINVFNWCARLDRLPTRCNLLNRGVVLESSLCPICGSVPEDAQHIFFSASWPNLCFFGSVVGGISTGSRSTLVEWFGECEKLGLAGEHGCFRRLKCDEEWETCVQVEECGWMQNAKPVMILYTETIDGSTIENKETALVWSYEDVDPDLGSCQAKELLDHLESVLVNEPVTVKEGRVVSRSNHSFSRTNFSKG
uniref:Alpha,alpha-trehalose-phosphate synthase [UDP-forming] 6-like n=1 Tax=Tanacetum cinerariifolium TaxID=118510 RepID=A0A699GI91_TANCI|nr:alpha,alpha-trehalose-phosphate synthase [UDP-forming] 6-like [Tanacetum cinerariifolium]